MNVPPPPPTLPSAEDLLAARTRVFLEDAGWDGAATVTSIPADFSSRRFARLERPHGAGPRTAILMQAGPLDQTPAFVALAAILRGLGLSAPEVYAAWPDEGLVLMEDLGGATFGGQLSAGAPPEAIYRRAARTLAHLHTRFEGTATTTLTLPRFDTAALVAKAEQFLDFYVPYVRGTPVRVEERDAFRAAWTEVLAPLEAATPTLMLRDFMPDNLMDLPERASPRDVGLIDFQDAGLGPAAYDLASLTEAVRRDHGAAYVDVVETTYREVRPGEDREALRTARTLLAAKRHTRVLGLLARCANEPARRSKAAFLPRVEAHTRGLLRDPALRPVAAWCQTAGVLRG